MGWHTSGLFIRGRTAEDIIGFLPDVFEYEPTGELVSGDQATMSLPAGRLYLARRDGWARMWCGTEPFPAHVDHLVQDAGPGPLENTLALAVVLESASDHWEWWLYDDSRLVRHVRYGFSEVVTSDGQPLPQEGDLERANRREDGSVDREEFLLALVRTTTGSIDDGKYAVYLVNRD